MNEILEYDIPWFSLVIIVIISIIYIIILIAVLKSKMTSIKPKTGSAEIPNEIIQTIKSVAQTGDAELKDIPYQDKYQTRLESTIDSSLKDYKIDKNSFTNMKKYIETNVRYKRRCLLVEIKDNKITFTTPNHKAKIWGRDGVDNRVFTFVRMITDLDQWCADNNLILPDCEFVIYVADTYVWEEVAKDLPWFIMVKPINRPGILIPDNSFISHGMSGDKGINTIKPGQWMWDKIIKKCKTLSYDKKEDMLYFKGANTGTYKFATRDYLSKYKWDIPVVIDLSTGREAMISWNKYMGLLNLPGHQPWSYRLKYLYLLKSPIVNVDVLLRYTDTSDKDCGDCLERWVQFFDPLFIPNRDYIQINQIYYDNPKLPRFNELRKESYDTLVDNIKSSYVKIKSKNTYAENAYKKISKLSTPRILQFLYVTIAKYAKNIRE